MSEKQISIETDLNPEDQKKSEWIAILRHIDGKIFDLIDKKIEDKNLGLQDVGLTIVQTKFLTGNLRSFRFALERQFQEPPGSINNADRQKIDPTQLSGYIQSLEEVPKLDSLLHDNQKKILSQLTTTLADHLGKAMKDVGLVSLHKGQKESLANNIYDQLTSSLVLALSRSEIDPATFHLGGLLEEVDFLPLLSEWMHKVNLADSREKQKRHKRRVLFQRRSRGESTIPPKPSLSDGEIAFSQQELEEDQLRSAVRTGLKSANEPVAKILALRKFSLLDRRVRGQSLKALTDKTTLSQLRHFRSVTENMREAHDALTNLQDILEVFISIKSEKQLASAFKQMKIPTEIAAVSTRLVELDTRISELDPPKTIRFEVQDDIARMSKESKTLPSESFDLWPPRLKTIKEAIIRVRKRITKIPDDLVLLRSGESSKVKWVTDRSLKFLGGIVAQLSDHLGVKLRPLMERSEYHMVLDLARALAARADIGSFAYQVAVDIARGQVKQNENQVKQKLSAAINRVQLPYSLLEKQAETIQLIQEVISQLDIDGPLEQFAQDVSRGMEAAALGKEELENFSSRLNELDTLLVSLNQAGEHQEEGQIQSLEDLGVV